MTAIWMRFQAELRSRWRPWLGLAALVGLAGGLVIGLVAGARRTDSSYSRFLDAQNAWDVVVFNHPDEGTAVVDFDEIAKLPQVADSARADAEYLSLGGGHPALAPIGDGLDTDMNKLEILEGRAADPDAPDEAVVPFTVAEDFDLEVGDVLELYFNSDELTAGVPLDRLSEDDRQFLANLRRLEAALPRGGLRIVGLEAAPGEFPPQFAAGTPVHLSPAFAAVDEFPAGEALAVQLRGGSADVAAFRAELEQRSPENKPIEMDVQAEYTQATQRSIHQQAVALWILGGLTALVGALIVAQLLARLTLLESAFDDVLSALGMSRRQRFALALTRAAMVGAVGAVVAVVVAVLISPFMPTGLARIAEPDPGVALDGLVFALGVVAVAAAVVALAAWPAWRASRTLGEQAAPARIAPSRVGEWLARAGASAASTIGVRMALEPGRGRRAVPVRTTLAVVSLGVAVFTAALVFGTSLGHLLDTPRLYGTTWDVRVTNYGTGPDLDTEGVAAAENVEGIDAFSVGELFIPLRLDGEQVDGLAIDSVDGNVVPPILDGRQPETPKEIVLGEKTGHDLGLAIGDQVVVEVSGSGKRQSFTVVGTGVLPSFSEGAGLGEGAYLTVSGVRRFTEAPEDGYTLLLDLAPGASEEAVVAGLRARLRDEFLTAVDDVTPTDIADFGRVRNTPLLLGGVLGLLAAGTLAHLLFSAVRRRRRDLAVLKALGFERRQCVSTVAWQANTVVGVGLLVGLPLGLVVGRWLWGAVADGLGVISEPRMSLVATALTVVGALVLANVIALIPAWTAANAPPAAALRAE